MKLSILQVCSVCHVAKSVSKYNQNKLDLVECPSNINMCFSMFVNLVANKQV